MPKTKDKVLYHGTSSALAAHILDEGLVKPCLTDDLRKARYYAECCAEEEPGSTPVVLVVQVHKLDNAALVPDVAAIEEPVLTGRSDEETWEHADKAVEQHSVESWRQLPWEAALEVSGSVRYEGTIPASKLYRVIDDLED